MGISIKRNLLIAVLINSVILFLVVVLCDIKYEVSDDFMIDAVLSGAYGNGENAHLMFSNILLGKMLEVLSRLLPFDISWYFVFQVMLCFVSLCAISYIVLANNSRIVGLVIAIVVVSFISDDVYLLMQYTKTATLSCCAGGALLLHGIWKEKQNLYEYAIGVILILLGSLLRFECLGIVIAFWVIMFQKHLAKYVKQNGWNRRIWTSFLECVVVVSAAVILYFINGIIWRGDSSFQDYVEYKKPLRGVTDVCTYGYDSVSKQFEDIGLSETDYYMVLSWNYLDETKFTKERLWSISNINKETHRECVNNIREIIQRFVAREYYKYTIVWSIGILLGIMLWLQPRGLLFEIIECIITVGLLLAFIWWGRSVYRVEYSILMCMTVSIATSMSVIEIDKKTTCVLGVILAALLICKIPLYLPDTSYKTMSDDEYARYIYDNFYESWNFKLSKYRCCVNKRKPHGSLLAQMEKDTEHYYLVDFSTGIQLIYYNYKPWEKVPAGIFTRYSYLGGVTMGYPDNYLVWESQGIDAHNPYRSLKNSNIYVVDNNYYETKRLYLIQEYGGDATINMVGEVDGFKIWKYR